MPWALEAGTISVTSAKGVGTGQSDDFLVVEPHSVENDSKVVLGLIVSHFVALHVKRDYEYLGGVRQSTVR